MLDSPQSQHGPGEDTEGDIDGWRCSENLLDDDGRTEDGPPLLDEVDGSVAGSPISPSRGSPLDDGQFSPISALDQAARGRPSCVSVPFNQAETGQQHEDVSVLGLRFCDL